LFLSGPPKCSSAAMLSFCRPGSPKIKHGLRSGSLAVDTTCTSDSIYPSLFVTVPYHGVNESALCRSGKQMLEFNPSAVLLPAVSFIAHSIAHPAAGTKSAYACTTAMQASNLNDYAWGPLSTTAGHHCWQVAPLLVRPMWHITSASKHPQNACKPAPSPAAAACQHTCCCR
jgi:hypothetical protein